MMVGPFDPNAQPDKSGTEVSGTGQSGLPGSPASRRTALGLILGAPLLGACAGVQQSISQFSLPGSSSPASGPAGPPAQSTSVGNGQVKVAVILPLSAGGNAAVAAQSMKNASEMALSEFLNPNLQLLIKDDAGSPQGAQQAAQQAVDEGAEIILGPLFATSVPAVAQVARSRGISVIAFSTDSSVASRGVYLLSFLPESDVNRIVEYAATIGKRSFGAILPENAYGNVVEAAFKQAVPKRGGRVVVFEKYGTDRAAAARNVAAALTTVDSLLLADDGDAVVATADALSAAGQFEKRTIARHGPLGQSAGVRKPDVAGRPVRGARPGRLPRLLHALQEQIRRRTGADRDARL
jgi:ABC-type branched-subunit amino acid transport system substrate-binding protein